MVDEREAKIGREAALDMSLRDCTHGIAVANSLECEDCVAERIALELSRYRELIVREGSEW